MKLYFVVCRCFLIALSILLSSNSVTSIEIRKIKFAERKFEFKYSEKDVLKETKEEDALIGSFNFISTPHFFPETGLDEKSYDLLGLKYNFTLVNQIKTLPGQLSLNSNYQLDKIAKNIFENFKKFQNGKKLKAFNILTLSQRLTRAIESARILNVKLNKLFNVTKNFNNDEVIKPFNLSIYNNTDIKEIDVLEKISTDSLAAYFIPEHYDREIFPINFKFSEKICTKIAKDFETNLNFDSVKNTYKKLLEEIFSKNKLEAKSFDLIDNNFVKVFYDLENRNNNSENKAKDLSREYTINNLYLNSYQNFIEMNNFFEFTNKLKTNINEDSLRKKTNFEMKNNKKSLKNFEFLEHLDEDTIKFLKSLIKKQSEILELINFDLFYLKNYSDDFVKIYSSEIFKFIMNVIYTYISPTQDEINKNLKNTILTNMFLKDYQLAGIYQILMKFKKQIDPKTNLFNTKDLPHITYGSVITMNVMHKKANLNSDNVINNFYIQILFDFKVVKTIAVSELLSIIANYISNDPAFFSKVCQ